jgi:hypothetical protein
LKVAYRQVGSNRFTGRIVFQSILKGQHRLFVLFPLVVNQAERIESFGCIPAQGFFFFTCLRGGDLRQGGFAWKI